MRWRKRDLWKAGITIAGMLLLLMLMVWVPVSVIEAHEKASGLAGPGTVTVQATPTEDATVTVLNKEKLAQEVLQLKNQNEPDPLGWLRTNASILLSTLVVVIGGLIGLGRWRVDRRDAQDKELEARRNAQDKELKDRQNEREKRAEERFQKAVEGLGSDNEGAKVGAASLLRTFLHPGYEQFYTQTFDLAVAHLRLRRTPPLSEDPDGIPHLPEDPNTPLPLTTLGQALIVVFREAFPLARSQNKGGSKSLDATDIKLDNAYLVEADLKQAWMPEASLRRVYLINANLSEVSLYRADLREANLSGADLQGTNLKGADLSGAKLNEAKLNEAKLREANLRGANLSGADLSGADLSWTDLSWTDLSGADLSGTNLREVGLYGAKLYGTEISWANNLSGADLREVHIEDTLYLRGTYLRGVKGLTKEQLAACKAKGAIIDEDTTTSAPQSTVTAPLPSQSDDVQAPSAPPAQGNLPAPDAGQRSDPSSQQAPDS